MPKVLRSDVLRSYHDNHAGGGHLGISKTYAAIREKYYFPGMYKVIHDYVATCHQCQKMKGIRKKLPPPLTSMPISDVFDRWHMDILGPLTKTEEGYQYILLVVDSFSRWSEAFPLKTQTAKEVSHVLYSEIFTRYGAPRILVSDRGQNFMSKLVRALCEMFDITRHHTSSYHPQTNSTCERLNSTLAQTLRMYSAPDQQNWPSLIPSVMMAFRISPATESTGLSPFHLVFGKEMNLPVDTSLIPKSTLGPDATDHFNNLIVRLKVVKEIATSNMRTKQEKSKEHYDKRAKEPGFSIGDRVMMRVTKVPTGLSPKLFQKYEGPLYITDIGPNYTYQLRWCGTHKQLKSLTNASRLVAYKDPYIVREAEPEIRDEKNKDDETSRETQQTEDATQNEPPTDQENPETGQPEPEQELQKEQEDNNKYHVNRLLKTKLIGNKRHYLVKWMGNFKDSWEPEDYITDKPKEEFHAHWTLTNRRKRKHRQYFRSDNSASIDQ
ncbi:MAG: DDE-type integrase/transposase/recombinase [Sedimenticola sp.]